MSQTKTARAGLSRTDYIRTHIFNPGLYVRTLLRLWVPGAVIGITLAVMALLISAAGETSYVYGYSVAYLCNTDVPITLLAFAMPFLCLSAFSFLRSRREADAAFSAPVTRTSLYLSATLAVLTVGVVLAVVIYLCTVLPAQSRGVMVINKYWMTGTDVPDLGVSLACFTRFSLYALCCGCMLCGFMTVAAVMSGGVGHTLLLCVLLTLAPSALIDVISNYSSRTKSMIWYLGADRFTYFDPLSMLLGNGSGFRAWWALPVLGMAILLFAVGGLLFRYRKAETAGDPAAGRWVLRFTICLFTAELIAYICISGEVLGLWLIGALVVLYCVYLLLTTRRLPLLLRCLPYALITAALTCLCVLGGYRIADAMMLNGEIRADKVESIFCSSNGVQESAYFDFSSKTNTFSGAAKKPNRALEIRDEELITQAVELYNQDREFLLANKRTKRTDVYQVYIAFYMKNGKCRTHRVTMTLDEYKDFSFRLHEVWYEMYQELIITLPPEAAAETVVGYRSYNRTYDNPSQTAQYRTYDARVEETFRREFGALDEAAKRSLVLSVDEPLGSDYCSSANELLKLRPQNGETSLRDLFVRFRYQPETVGADAAYYRLYFKIDPDVLPETYSLICELNPQTERFLAGGVPIGNLDIAYELK